MEKTLDQAFKEIRRLDRLVKKLSGQVEDLAKVVNALAPVVTDLVLTKEQGEGEEPVLISAHDEGGGDWVTQ